MDAVGLSARYGRTVEVDVCGGCGGLWFDHAESQQLSPGATLRLLDRLTLRPSRQIGARSACPRCRQTLLDVHDQQRATRFTYRRCTSGHGRFITAYHFLREKHLVRELTVAEIDEVRARIQQINCVNCGAPVSLAGALACGHCGTAVSMVDPQQLRRELSALSLSETREGDVDPTLPMRLMRERAAAERVWAGMPGERSWVDELMAGEPSGIAQAAIRLLGMRLG
jgi:uncharacterized protein YbaR (Trm112 family)